MPKKRKIELHGEDGPRIYAKLASDVSRELARAFRIEAKHQGLTKKDIADRIGAHKALVTRSMGGTGNLTLRTTAALFAAMGHELEVRARRVDAPPIRRLGAPRHPASSRLGRLSRPEGRSRLVA